jgi:hypothetical protein
MFGFCRLHLTVTYSSFCCLGVDALGRKVSPEGIAAYESELAAMQRLSDLGIQDLYLGTNALANVSRYRRLNISIPNSL